MAASRKCIFCGNTKLSREHVFPDWMKAYLGSEQKTVIEATSRSGEVRQHGSKPFEHKVKVVCESCNHGWMSLLENEVKPYFGSMISFTDTPVLVNEEQMKHLATWAVKTLLVAQYAVSGDPIISEDHYCKLYKNKVPSSETRVLMAFRDASFNKPGQTLVGIDTKEIGDVKIPKVEHEYFKRFQESGERPYFGTIRVGRVVFFISGHNMSGAETGHVNGLPAGYLLDLWPQPEHSQINFPTTLPLDLYGGPEKMFNFLYETIGIRKIKQS